MPIDSILFSPERAAACERLQSFLPDAGKPYARTRNADHGSLEDNGVSGLSPYLRRRMITEEEVCRAVMESQGFEAAEKYVQEVCWRTYWKGWLELRPSIWRTYTDALMERRGEFTEDADKAERWNRALAGETGIGCFDYWVDELWDTGYLHNHARMWFAGIWIYSLGLPWELGADMFARRLLDGDPASNTLSWRWVAGLHTSGKRYKPRASNIRRYTDGRFESLTEIPLEYPGPDFEELPESRKLEGLETELPSSFTLWLCAEDWALDLPDELLRGAEKVVLLSMDDWPDFWRPNDKVLRFEDATRMDAQARWSETCEVSEMTFSDLRDGRPFGEGKNVVMPAVPRGTRRDRLEEVWETLGARPQFWTREWDRNAWLHATAGFFRFWKKFRKTVQELPSG